MQMISHVLICLLNSNFTSFKRISLGVFRIKREVPALHCQGQYFFTKGRFRLVLRPGLSRVVCLSGLQNGCPGPSIDNGQDSGKASCLLSTELTVIPAGRSRGHVTRLMYMHAGADPPMV